jgi:ABC-type enterochelin transport system permease subunit
VTIVLPPFLPLLGIILGGVAIGVAAYFTLGFIALLFMDSSELGSWAAVLAAPVGLLAAVAGWMWLPTFL